MAATVPNTYYCLPMPGNAGEKVCQHHQKEIPAATLLACPLQRMEYNGIPKTAEKGKCDGDNKNGTAFYNTATINALGLWVHVGSTHVNDGGRSIKVRQIFQHPKQNSWSDYDFSLLHLDRPLSFSESVQPIRLRRPSESEGDGELSDGTLCKVSGWGNTHNPDESALVLRAASVPLTNHRQCSEVYEGIGSVTESMICAGYDEGGKDSCQGDSGGPLVCDGQLTGVVSWGKGCAEPGFPGVYAKVAIAFEWIERTLQVERVSAAPDEVEAF
uniref:Peptidase S1 domain-containing protein n=1 Tax=Anopheles funestus TaxID=62324 RepID=A0A182RWT2_ANOFN